MGDKTPNLDLGLVRDLAALLKETELSEIEVERDDFRVRVARSVTVAAAPQPVAAIPAEPAKSSRAAPRGGVDAPAAGSLADPARHPGCVPSPMVGTAYLSAEPGAAPYVEVGATVRAGQTILIVEAMKHMNEVAAPRAGTVVEILVEDGQPVEYAEPLMIIE